MSQHFSYAYSLKNQEVTLTNCDREPVHVPGCIQPFGVLLSIDPAQLHVLQVSENTTDWLAQEPQKLLGHPLEKAVGAEAAHALRAAIDQRALELLPRFICSFVIQGRRLEMLAHQSGDSIIIECEDYTQSELTRDQTYAEISRIAATLQRAGDLRNFAQVLADNIRRLTGLDRVMIYRFHEDLSGEVFAEAKREDLYAYFGLRYPSEDIPHPAREIFRKIWVRPVPAIDHLPCGILPLLDPRTQKPLDMTYCFLRGASVMYTDYLKNMGVAMAITLSIIVDGKLWGLVACHHYTPKIIPWPQRAACELLAQIASLKMKNAETREYADYRARMENSAHTLIEEMRAEGRNVSELLQSSPALFHYVEADGIAVLEDGKWFTLGETPTSAEMTALVECVKDTFSQAPLGTEIVHTHALSETYPSAAAYQTKVSGLLAMPVSRHYDPLIFWFRKEVPQTVSWAGDPHSKTIVDGPGGSRLLPRSSFEIWQEQVRGHSAPWKTMEIEAARRLRLALMEVMVMRTQTIVRQNRELAASNEELDAFAYITSHDLREPLRGIYHYAYGLKESAEALHETGMVGKSDNLMKLARRMDGLIESLLHLSRLGRTSLLKEEVHMCELALEAVDIVRASRADKYPDICISENLGYCEGDAVRLRELWLNLISNAVKYNDHERPRVEIGQMQGETGTIYFVRDNGIGIAPEHKNLVFHIFKRMHGKDAYGGGSGAGLAIVHKIIERHQGKIWIESELGKGSTFYFTLGSAA